MEYPSATQKKPETIIYMRDINDDNFSDAPIAASAPGDWLVAPQSLKGDVWSERALDAYDIALCVIPACLIVKIILCIVAWHSDNWATGFWADDASNLTVYLIRFNGQLTTAFTIIFVLILTTCLRRFALWRAQSGEYLARLEQYQASTSLPSTLRLVLSLRSYNLISVVLVSIWSFYYVGSQASKAEYRYETLRDYGHRGEFGVAYPASNTPSYYQTKEYVTDKPQDRQAVIYNFDLNYLPVIEEVATNAFKGCDSAGNVLVPVVGADGSINVTDAKGRLVVADKHGWYNIGKESSIEYSSYAGITFFAQPFFDVNNTLFSGGGDNGYGEIGGDLEITTSIMNLAECGAGPEFVNISGSPGSDSPALWFTLNVTSPHANSTTTAESPKTLEVWSGLGENAYKAVCQITSFMVDLKVHCDGTICASSGIRRTPGKPLVDYRTPFDDAVLATNFFDQLVASSASLFKQQTGWQAGEDCLQEPATIQECLETWDNAGDGMNITQFDPVRLSQFVSTLYITSQMYAANNYVYNLEYLSEAKYPPMWNITSGETSSPDFPWAVTRIKRGKVYLPSYVLSIPWIVADMMSNTILLGAAVFSFWLRKRTLAPDIFGYVSSLTRDNPNLHLPDGGTALSGLDRARMLRDVKVRIVDLGTSGSVGRVALTHADAPNTQYSDLRLGKQYA